MKDWAEFDRMANENSYLYGDRLIPHRAILAIYFKSKQAAYSTPEGIVLASFDDEQFQEFFQWFIEPWQ